MAEIKRIDPGSRMSEAVVYNGVIYSSGVVADWAAYADIFMGRLLGVHEVDIPPNV